jgi:hypothetical protein
MFISDVDDEADQTLERAFFDSYNLANTNVWTRLTGYARIYNLANGFDFLLIDRRRSACNTHNGLHTGCRQDGEPRRGIEATK